MDINIKEVKASIKIHEGYRLDSYHCTEGFLSGGYGHKILDGEDIPKDEEGWSKLFDKDFKIAFNGAKRLVGEHQVHSESLGILIEMCFQLGEFGVSKFKKMIAAIKREDYVSASVEMLDSKWSSQTPERAQALAARMKNI